MLGHVCGHMLVKFLKSKDEDKSEYLVTERTGYLFAMERESISFRTFLSATLKVKFLGATFVESWGKKD